jgi:hypothetical protein
MKSVFSTLYKSIMKYLLVLAISLSLSNLYGHEFPLGSYINISKSEQLSAHIVRLSTPGGNVEKATKAISKLDKASFSHHLHYGLLHYQLYGKNFIEKYEDSLRLFGFTPQQVLFANMWWADKSGNFQDFYHYNAQYQAQFGNELYRLKFETLFLTMPTIIHDWERDTDRELEQLASQINQLLATGNLSSDDSLTALLLLCDINDQLELSADSEVFSKQIFSTLQVIWNKFPNAVDPEKLADKLENLDSRKANDLALKVLSTITPKSDEEGVKLAFRYLENVLNRESYRPEDILHLEKLLTELINNQSSEITKLRMKSLVNCVVDDDLPIDLPIDFYDADPEMFTAAFKAFIKEGVTDGQVLSVTKIFTTEAGKLMDEDFQAVVKEVQALMNDEQWALLSSLDKAALLGASELMMQQTYSLVQSSFVQDFIGGIENIRTYSSMLDFTNAISANPLLLDKGNLEFNSTLSKRDINTGLDFLNGLSQKYPGSLAILKNRLKLLFLHDEIADAEKSKQASDMVRLVMHIFELSQLEGSELVDGTEIDDYFLGHSNTGSYHDLSLVHDQLNDQDRTILATELKKKVEAFPNYYNLNLLYLNYLLYADEIAAYLDQYVDLVLIYPDTRETLIMSRVEDLDQDYIRAAFQRFHSKKPSVDERYINKIEAPLLELMQE